MAAVSLRHRILSHLEYRSPLRFNQLWDREEQSNKFTYHLHKLEKEGLIKKTAKGYTLSSLGKRYASRMEREQDSFPIVAVIPILFDSSQKKVLLLERAKEPFRGYFGFHGGKLASSQYILTYAQSCFQKETGLLCDMELKGLFSSKTFEKDTLSYSHQLFIVRATHPSGKLLSQTSKGKNHWVVLSSLSEHRLLPNISLLLKIASSKRFRWIEADRFLEQDAFVDLVVHKDVLL